MAVAGGGPADLTFTPKTEAQMTNIDVARAYAKNYYGAPTAVSGSGATATWDAPLNVTSNYANEARSVAAKGVKWLTRHRNVANRAIVLDVDDTTLTTWNYELYSNWDFNPTTNASFVGLTGTTFTGNMFPATPGMLDLVNQAKGLGYAIFWITGRGDSQHAATIANLVSDSAAGLPDIDTRDVEREDRSRGRRRLSDGHAGRHRPRRLRRRPVHQAAGRLVPELPRQARVLRPGHRRRGVLRDHSVQVGDARLHRVAGLRHRGRLRRPVQRPAGWLRGRTFKMPNPNYYLP